MKNRDGLDNSDHWETPEWLYNELNKEFKFDYDPCPLNATFDSLAMEDWPGTSIFINPPYNRVDKPRFIAKAYSEWRKGKTCVLLIPAATGTKQFHELILPHAEVRFLKGRVAFKGYNTKGEYSTKNKGKHDSMIVIFRKEKLLIDRIGDTIKPMVDEAVADLIDFGEHVKDDKEIAKLYTMLIERDQAIDLLEKYSEFLAKHGYMDEDWRQEPPYAIDEFLKTL